VVARVAVQVDEELAVWEAGQQLARRVVGEGGLADAGLAVDGVDGDDRARRPGLLHRVADAGEFVDPAGERREVAAQLVHRRRLVLRRVDLGDLLECPVQLQDLGPGGVLDRLGSAVQAAREPRVDDVTADSPLPLARLDVGDPGHAAADRRGDILLLQACAGAQGGEAPAEFPAFGFGHCLSSISV
jgi:hypothetical protein